MRPSAAATSANASTAKTRCGLMTGAVALLVLAALDVANLCSIILATTDEKAVLNLATVPFGVKEEPQSKGEEQQGICQRLCRDAQGCSSRNGGGGLSTTALWNQWRHKILEASSHYHDITSANNNNNNNHTTSSELFRDWMDSLLTHFTSERMIQSVDYPANSKSMAEVVRILDESTANNNGRNDNNNTRQLHIMVLGGSVTLGLKCNQNPIDKTAVKSGVKCAWAGRWEHLINQVIFNGEQVVNVTNSATGSTSSDIGAMALEYQLYQEPELPDVVVSAFATNDIQHPVPPLEKLKNMERFIAAAESLHSCENHKPLVVMVDDFCGLPDKEHSVHDVMAHSALIHQATAWHQSMGVSYANIVRTNVYSHPNASVEGGQIPLVSSGYVCHMGMAFHIGMAWTLLYNLLNALVEHCNEKTSAPPAVTTAITDDPFSATELSVQHIPHLADHHPRRSTLRSDWTERQEKETLRCHQHTDDDEQSVAAEKPCTCAWMVSQMTGVCAKPHVKKVLQPVLFSNAGWKHDGSMVKQPRVGWCPSTAHATFVVRVVADDEKPIQFLNVLYLKTYDQGDSLLRVTTKVLHRDGSNKTEGTFELGNLHKVRTSVHYQEKFELPSGGAAPGETVETTFELVRGEKFKIAGLAYCTR